MADCSRKVMLHFNENGITISENRLVVIYLKRNVKAGAKHPAPRTAQCCKLSKEPILKRRGSRKFDL